MKRFIVFIFLLAFLALNFLSATKESLTYDEPVHLKAGVEEWQTRIFSLDTNNPPLIRELAALPVVLGVNPGRQYLIPRMVITFLAAILGLAIFKYAQKIFDWLAGLVALFLFTFEPDFLAHSHYVTLDVGTALFFFLGFIFGEKFAEKQTLGGAFLFGVLSGLAFASKITIIPVYFLTFVLIFWRKRKSFSSGFWKKIVFLSFVCLLTIWATYFFTFSPIVAEREDPTRLSEKIIRFAQEKSLPILKEIVFWLKLRPLPLGYFLATIKNGLVFNLFPSRIGIGQNEKFLPLVLFLKIPLPLWILFLLGLIGLIGQIGKNLLFPFVLMVLLFSFSSAPARIRYLLPVFPFLIIIAAGGAKMLWEKKRGKGILLGLLIWYFLSSIFSFPHFISYANELAGFGKEKAFLFSDSNYDWGQSLPDLAKYVREKGVSQLKLSYFGTDNPENYGLVADRPFGEKFEERCPLYLIKLKEEGQKITAISLSNWYYCGWREKEEFAKDKVSEIVGGVFLIFRE